MATPAGQQLLAASAAATGTTPAQLSQVISALPPLDLYVPSKEDRLSWQGTANVMISVALEPDRSLLAGSDPKGNNVAVSGSTKSQNRPVVILLYPSEPKGRRLNPQPDVPGSVIQDADDGEIAVEWIEISADGSTASNTSSLEPYSSVQPLIIDVIL